MLNDLIEEFRDTIDLDGYFSHFSFEVAKDEILNSKSNLIFLIGDPGAGKSFLLNFLYYKHNKNYILIKKPFISKDEFLENYNYLGKKILIDEAQLLDIKMIEFLRILSDNGHQVIFSMHKKEGEKIINLPQFKSRYAQIIELKQMRYKEFEKYVYSKFIKHQKVYLLDKKILKKVYKFSQGNFRISKKFIFTMVTLLNFSLNKGLKYAKLDNCILEMTAIELGFLK